jgi:hypothetical protein
MPKYYIVLLRLEELDVVLDILVYTVIIRGDHFILYWVAIPETGKSWHIVCIVANTDLI